MKRLSIIIICCLCVITSYAQKESHDVRHGNGNYKKDNFVEAETDYRRGLDKNNDSFEAHFNLGDALFKQEKYPEAQEEYSKAGALLTDKDKKRQAAVYHNIGNSCFAQQQYDKAVAAYKQSLKANPKDDDTRYNLVKAMQMLQQQQQQQQQNQDQNKDQQQQQEQQQEQQQNQDQNKNQQQQQQDQMDKEQAEQILQALEQDEKAAQEKAQKQQMQGGRKAEKDW